MFIINPPWLSNRQFYKKHVVGRLPTLLLLLLWVYVLFVPLQTWTLLLAPPYPAIHNTHINTPVKEICLSEQVL